MKDENKYFCERCNALVEATRTPRLARVPPVITLHLNRSSSSGAGSEKVRTVVQIPFHFSLSQWCPGKSAPSTVSGRSGATDPVLRKCSGWTQPHELRAAIFHSGHTASSGHYVCYVRTDDRSTTNVKPAKIVENASSMTVVTNPATDRDRDDVSAPPTPRGRWTLFDDSGVRYVGEAEMRLLLSARNISSSTAYMLFYEA